MATETVQLIRGDTNKINLAIRRKQMDADGVPVRNVDGTFIYLPVDLTGASLTLTARTAAGAVSFAFSTTGGGIAVIAPTTSGNAVVTIPPATTEPMTTPTWLKYDVQLVEADTTRTTVAKGQIVVSTDVTF